jgi:hypothetical protein
MRNRILVLISTIIAFVLFLVCGPQSVSYGQPLAKITVEAGSRTRIDTPVSATLEAIPDAMRRAPIGLMEVRGSERLPVLSQIEPGDPPKLWWVLSGTTPAGSERTYELVRGQSAGVSGIEVTKNDSFLEIQAGARKILRYNHASVSPPAGQSPLFTRSGFIHPLWSPSGAILTNIHPADHIHHLGIWMPWTKAKFEDKEVDFWNLGEGQGTVRFVKFLSTTSGPVYGGFQAEHDHVALKTSAGEKVVLKETWDVRVYNISGQGEALDGIEPASGGPEKGYWLWDFVSTQRCASDSPLYQMEYRYGGFGFRGAAQWEGENGMYLTSEGKTRKDGHGTRVRWCDMAGRIDDKWQGLTVMSHPGNFRHPEPIRIWPEGQVFFNFAPSQLGDWIMEPGKDYVFRYRLYVHEGKVNVGDAERIWCDYAEPPNVKLEPVSKADKITLFDGKDFSHWTHEDGKPVQWEIEDSAMKAIPNTGSIVTKQNFRDFKLHIEFKIPQMPPDVKGQGRGNSGVYLQRRYEVQILDSYGLEPTKDGCGSLYKQKAPDKNACKKPGEWQSYDITFRAARFEGEGENLKKVENARITVVHNGVLIHDDVELPSKTGAGRPEGPEPGVILLQEHGNEVWFRNIWIVPL